LALLLAPYLRKFGKFTVPEFIGDRFYSQTARIIGVICLLVVSITYVIGQMTGVGVTFSRYLEVSNSTGLWIGAALVFCYAVLGGMKGITYTQVAQYIVLIIAYTIPAVFISMQLTGNPLPQLGLFGTHTESGMPLLQKLDDIVTDLGFRSYTGHYMSTLDMFLFTMALMIGTAGLPHVIIRFFTVPKVSDARSSAGWALVFIAALYTVAPAVGAMARMNLTTTMWPESSTTATAYEGEAVSLEAIETAPELQWMRNWQVTGLLNWEDKNGDGLIQYYSDRAGATDGQGRPMEEIAAEQGWAGNELVTVNNDIMVLANPEIANLPGWVVAIVAAGGLAAALSTAAGLLLAISGAVSHDLIKGSIAPHISEREELMWARVSMAASILVATILGLNPPGFAAQTVALAFGLAASSIFPVLMMGIFSKRVNSHGAIWGMLAGMIATTVYIFTYKGWFFIAGTNMLADTPDNWLFGISPASFGTVGALINFGVAYLVSSMTKEPPAEVVELVESIRIPRGAGTAVDH
ncbi:MAG: sodium:solute symporter family protein, partial [Paracoccus sp. (in: a-proteobacteria)]|nr:sodium:solute symporter family protein [Paracoccus sp. (in: a-proteobacteria)]